MPLFNFYLPWELELRIFNLLPKQRAIASKVSRSWRRFINLRFGAAALRSFYEQNITTPSLAVWAFGNQELTPRPRAYSHAARTGDLNLARKLLELGVKPGWGSFAGAVKNGRVEFLTWLLEEFPSYFSDPHYSFSELAAEKSQLEVLGWLRRMGVLKISSAFEGAVKGDSLPVLNWLWELDFQEEEYKENSTLHASLLAAEKGSILFLEWFEQRGLLALPYVRKNIFCSAVFANKPELLDWLWEKGFTFDTRAGIRAARVGRISTMNWFFEKGLELTVEMFAVAARFGHLELLLWLRERNCPWNSRARSLAQREGRLETLRLLTQMGAP